MAVNLSPVAGAAQQFFTDSGVPLAGGFLYTYAAGTTTPATTYTSSSGNTAWSNPIVLNSAGRISGSGEIWLTDNASYKFVLKDSSGVLIATYDNIIGINATVDSSQVPYDPPFSGSVVTNVESKLSQIVSVKDFGATGNGTTDDTSAIQAAITNSNSETIIYFPQGTYKITSTLEMPLKVSGNFTIDGNIKWSFKKEILQQGQITVTGTILLDSVWYSKFMHLESVGDVTIQSSNVTWGTFWNDFGTIRCAKLIIDVDQGQSVNQNNFSSCKCSGGIHIRGTNTSGIREAHNNVFVSVDTTGANMANANGTGYHILNDSNLNQTNTVINWYAEISGSCTCAGNWNILGDNVDIANPAFIAGRENYRLGARAQGRQSSYLPIVVNNAAQGGDWGILKSTGIPTSISGSSGVLMYQNAAPDGGWPSWKVTGGSTFQSIDITYALSGSTRLSGTAYIYIEGNPSKTVELYSGGVLQTSGASNYVSLGGGWYLFRFSGSSAQYNISSGYTTGTVRIYVTTSSALTSSDFMAIGSYFITTETIAPLPSRSSKVVGYGTAFPTAGVWSQGDICWNTTPSAGGTPGWVCTTAGNPGTWKAMANLAA